MKEVVLKLNEAAYDWFLRSREKFKDDSDSCWLMTILDAAGQ